MWENKCQVRVRNHRREAQSKMTTWKKGLSNFISGFRRRSLFQNIRQRQERNGEKHLSCWSSWDGTVASEMFLSISLPSLSDVLTSPVKTKKEEIHCRWLKADAAIFKSTLILTRPKLFLRWVLCLDKDCHLCRQSLGPKPHSKFHEICPDNFHDTA